MKRYYIVNEYFGIRVYDTINKKEYYYETKYVDQIKQMLDNQYILINHPKEKRLSAPLKISMNLTKKCNLRCIQCFSNSGIATERELSTKDMYKLFDEMEKNGTFFICLGGGEPFTRKDIFEILEYGKNKRLAISIVSNGLLLNEEMIKELNTMNLDYLWISFEGMKENHERLRGIGTFDKTLKTLELLKKFYKGKTALRMSINKYNIDECEMLVKIGEEYNVNLIRFTPLLDFGRAKNEDLVINGKQYIKFLKNVSQIKSQKVEIVYPNTPTNKFWVGTNGFGCHCGKEALWIDEVGTVSPCIFWGDAYNVGNIKTDDYSELWNQSLNKSVIKGNKICETCKNYATCRSGCRARSLYAYGNLDEVDPLCPLRKGSSVKI